MSAFFFVQLEVPRSANDDAQTYSFQKMSAPTVNHFSHPGSIWDIITPTIAVIGHVWLHELPPSRQNFPSEEIPFSSQDFYSVIFSNRRYLFSYSYTECPEKNPHLPNIFGTGIQWLRTPECCFFLTPCITRVLTRGGLHTSEYNVGKLEAMLVLARHNYIYLRLSMCVCVPSLLLALFYIGAKKR